MNQPLCSLHCAAAPGLWSRGWRRRLGRKIHFSQLPHLQSSGRRLPTCLCPPKPALCLPQARSVMQLPGVSEGAFGKQLPLSGSSWQLYVPGQPQESEPEIHRTPGLLPPRLRAKKPAWIDSFLQIWLPESAMRALARISVSNPYSFTPCTSALPYQ